MWAYISATRAAIKKQQKEKHSLEVETAEIRKEYEAAVEKYIVEHGKTKLWSLNEDIKFVLERDRLLHNHELGQPLGTQCCSSAA